MFFRAQLEGELKGEQLLYAESSRQLLHESQLDAPGPLKSPLGHAVHSLAPAALYVPGSQITQTGWPMSAYFLR